MAIVWTPDMNTGIDVIDKQHSRIVDYINELEEAIAQHDDPAIGHVLEACVDYTLSHFAFEESLQEEAGYKYCKPHKKVHEMFASRIDEYKARYLLGEDIAPELHTLLQRWLVTHIKQDDADYVAAVKASVAAEAAPKSEGRRWFRRLFN